MKLGVLPKGGENMRNIAFGKPAFKILLWLVLCIPMVWIGLQFPEGMMCFGVFIPLAFAMFVVSDWVVRLIHKNKEHRKPYLNQKLRKIVGILSIVPIPVFLILLLVFPNQGLALLPVGVLAAGLAFALGGLASSKQKPFYGWIGLGLSLVFYLFVLAVYLSSQ
jgi:small-conductance mechanosensitive channel